MFMLRRENFERLSAQRYLVNAVKLARSAGLRRELAEYLSYPIWLYIDNSDYDTRLAARLEAVALSKEIADKRLEMESPSTWLNSIFGTKSLMRHNRLQRQFYSYLRRWGILTVN